MNTTSQEMITSTEEEGWDCDWRRAHEDFVLAVSWDVITKVFIWYLLNCTYVSYTSLNGCYISQEKKVRKLYVWFRYNKIANQ